MKFEVKQERTYVTWMTIDADTIEEANEIYLEMRNDGTAFSEELEQCNIDNDIVTIFKP